MIDIMVWLVALDFLQLHQTPPKYPQVRSDQNPGWLGLFWRFYYPVI